MKLHLTDEDHDGAFHMFAFGIPEMPVLLGVTYCNERLEEVVLQYIVELPGGPGVMEELELVITNDAVSEVCVCLDTLRYGFDGTWEGFVTHDMFHSAPTKFNKAIIEFVHKLRLEPITIDLPEHQSTMSDLMKVFKIEP